MSDSKKGGDLGKSAVSRHDTKGDPPPYASSSTPSFPSRNGLIATRPHTNKVIEAAKLRAKDEQDMQTMLQTVQIRHNIYNPEIEPEHEVERVCSCDICRYTWAKRNRLDVLKKWSEAVKYPGEKSYNDMPLFGVSMKNPYYYVQNPSGYQNGMQRVNYGYSRPRPHSHAMFVEQTIELNAKLNKKAQLDVDALQPAVNIWDEDELGALTSKMAITTVNDTRNESAYDAKIRAEESGSAGKKPSIDVPQADGNGRRRSMFASFKSHVGLKSSEEKAVGRASKQHGQYCELRNDVLTEEQARWPDEQWRSIVAMYQEKVGMTRKIADLRAHKPLEYLHLLRAGYFEPIPVAWAGSVSNPLKFSIEAKAGWRGITPQWRGYEDTAEERLYWVLNHREGSTGMRMKPDFISEMSMAMSRMASAVEPPPQYYSPNDTCYLQHTSNGYSKQVMPAPFKAYDRPELATDDTMILLDTSGSMDFESFRPVYEQYLITGYYRSSQPKNKDVAKSIMRRFVDAMSNHDHQFAGYSLVTFANEAQHIGTINHQNFDQMSKRIRIGGGTRVMTGWQKVKELHFEKHSESAIHHPVLGWQAGPETPMLRLLLFLDGEATDMDEFELDLLGVSWAHVTVFLIGTEGCIHHHRHANELQRISDVNHHVSFIDAQGNTPERFVTHELLKRHLGYALSIQEFEELEQPPPYSM